MVSHLTWSSCSFNEAGSQQAPTILPPLSRSAGVIGVDGILLLFTWVLGSDLTLHLLLARWTLSQLSQIFTSPPAPVSLTEGEARWLAAGRLVSSCPCLFSTGIVGTHCWPFLWVLGIRTQVLMLTQAVSHLPSSRGRLLLCVLFTVLKFVCEFQWSNPPIFLEVKSDCAALSPWNSIVNQADLEFREVLQPIYLRLGLKTCATTSRYFSLKKKSFGSEGRGWDGLV